MATTTNYGWTTPDDTALVKDGASAIRTLGTSVDTTTKNLNPETTLGDIAYRSSTSNVNTRLGIGTTGQVLSVSGGVPAWATASSGGMTLLSTTTLSGATTTISSISQDYTKLLILGLDIIANFNGENMRIDLNASGNTHFGGGVKNSTTTVTGFEYNNTTIEFGESATSLTNNRGAQVVFNLYNYTSTGTKFYDYSSNVRDDSNVNKSFTGAGTYDVASAVTSIKFTVDSASWSGGTILIYGVK
jgi:hypothetical protein